MLGIMILCDAYAGELQYIAQKMNELNNPYSLPKDQVMYTRTDFDELIEEYKQIKHRLDLIESSGRV